MNGYVEFLVVVAANIYITRSFLEFVLCVAHLVYGNKDKGPCNERVN